MTGINQWDLAIINKISFMLFLHPSGVFPHTHYDLNNFLNKNAMKKKHAHTVLTSGINWEHSSGKICITSTTIMIVIETIMALNMQLNPIWKDNVTAKPPWCDIPIRNEIDLSSCVCAADAGSGYGDGIVEQIQKKEKKFTMKGKRKTTCDRTNGNFSLLYFPTVSSSHTRSLYVCVLNTDLPWCERLVLCIRCLFDCFYFSFANLSVFGTTWTTISLLFVDRKLKTIERIYTNTHKYKQTPAEEKWRRRRRRRWREKMQSIHKSGFAFVFYGAQGKIISPKTK